MSAPGRVNTAACTAKPRQTECGGSQREGRRDARRPAPGRAVDRIAARLRIFGKTSANILTNPHFYGILMAKSNVLCDWRNERGAPRRSGEQTCRQAVCRPVGGDSVSYSERCSSAECLPLPTVWARLIAGVKCALLYFPAGIAPVCRGRPPPESDKGKGPGREKRARE